MSVVIETTVGDLTVDLFLTERPRACLNFLKLCKLKYYNYNLFHTIQEGFIAQTGDPSGEGNGGESVWGLIEGPDKRFFEAEYLPKIRHSEPGLLSMVSLGESLIGSQFFFTLGSDLTSLDGIHCVIGHVVEGLDVLRTINEVICDNTNRPYKDVRITHTVILDDPFENPRGFREPSRSPSPSAERLRNGRIAADEDVDETNGKDETELAEMRLEREAKARATILEIIGDLPDAEIAPPENVLFVCKLNSVTTDDDLEIIFSRFGKIKGCEVIRDRKTGDSLQYAFIEFEDKKSCEMAYFKMDNVLIDDRRIHVDFSQSVSKLQWRGKGRGFIMKDGSQNTRLDFNNYNKPIRENERDRGRNDRGGYNKPNRDMSRQNDNRRNRSPRRDQVNERRERQRSRSRSPYDNRRPQRSNDRNTFRRNYSPDRNYRRDDRDSNRRRDDRDATNRRDVREDRDVGKRRDDRNDRDGNKRWNDREDRDLSRRRDDRDSSNRRNDAARRYDKSRRSPSIERRVSHRSPSVEKRKSHKSDKKSNKKNKKEKSKEKDKKHKKKKTSKKHKKNSSSDSSSSDSDSSSSSSSS
ncbi:peptidyl-prolyl cis-trans isomerase sig-7 [Sitodiplosis mosellana]|uniref:peptidyl-prolyl cis-trans isomerase sig-7 n=1 Tax=Sitodiplosis mosellana TaxID=263140 RepID=UPI00244466AB|nr:peptidyl-prolyl cis-trans isomerase sig-7 [Sitodiplosis mosellana]